MRRRRGSICGAKNSPSATFWHRLADQDEASVAPVATYVLPFEIFWILVDAVSYLFCGASART
jgi:hypothetical protein